MAESQIELERSNIVLRKIDGAVVAAIPQFGLFAQGASVPDALALLEEKKAALLKEFAAFSVLQDIPAAQHASPSVRWSEITQFAIKTAIVFALIIATLMYSAIKLEEVAMNTFYRLQMEVQRIAPLNTRDFVQKLERELERAARPDHDIPPDKKQKMLADIHTIVERWRPFVAEAAAVLPPQNAPTAPRAP